MPLLLVFDVITTYMQMSERWTLEVIDASGLLPAYLLVFEVTYTWSSEKIEIPEHRQLFSDSC